MLLKNTIYFNAFKSSGNGDILLDSSKIFYIHDSLRMTM